MEAPPRYERLYGGDQENGPVEQFEVEEPWNGASCSGDPSGGSVASRLKARLIVPVRHFVVDPVAKLWARTNRRIDEILDPYINPLLARRICVLVFTSLVLSAVYFTHLRDPLDSDLNAAELRALATGYLDAEDMAQLAAYLDSMPHYAGTAADYTTSNFLLEKLQSLGLDVAGMAPQRAYISYPNSTHVWLQGAEIIQYGDENEHEQVKDRRRRPIPQMALASSGDVSGHLVYANHGGISDIKFLKDNGIGISGKIALVRYGRGEPALTAMRLAEAGVAGVLFFSEKTSGTAPWPDGPDYAEDAIQRASLGVPEIYPGDILSPGWTSQAQMHITDWEAVRNVAKIPVVPVSWNSVTPFLQRLKGLGVQAPEDWTNYGYPRDVEWWTGDDSDDCPDARMQINAVVEERHVFNNVIGRIFGVEEDRQAVILGAKLDTFCYGGVALSGLVVMLQVAKALAYLRYEHNWRPLRPIYFMAFDGTTQNFAGSAEWVEGVEELLKNSAALYVDLDSGVYGDQLVAKGNPLLDIDELVREVSLHNNTVEAEPGVPVAFGNHNSFESHAGVPSISLGFRGAVYPKDSCFDTLEWQRKFGDSDFAAHKALAELVTLTVLKYADSPVMPLNVARLGEHAHKYIDDLKHYAEQNLGKAAAEGLDFSELVKAADDIVDAGVKVRDRAAAWASLTLTGSVHEVPAAKSFRLQWNERVSQFNKLLLEKTGLHDRNWFKHVVYGPQFDRDVDDDLSGTFPGIRDGIRAHDMEVIKHAIASAAERMQEAAASVLYG